MDKAQITTLLSGNVADISAQLGTLDRESLVELQAQEIAGGNRSTLLKAIDDALVALDDGGDDHSAVDGTPGAEATPPAAPGNASAKTPAKPAKEELPAKPAKEEAPAWMAPDYAGPLTGEQAAWRVANLKPARKASTK